MERSLERMMHSLRHRGPDAQGVISDKKIGITLGNARLSIIDLSEAGRQPMSNDAGNIWIVNNGEIYNYQEIRTQLGSNYKFISQSDTEVMLHAYEQWGVDCFHRFDGMFACAILDKRHNKLFLIRDRAGVKPCYYYHKDGIFAFASELNSLYQVLHPQIESVNVYTYLRLGFFYKTDTPYRDIFELLPGSVLELNLLSNTATMRKWWDISTFYHRACQDSWNEAFNKVDCCLHTAVKRRLESSDREVGVFLSSGIDSALVAAIAAQYQPHLKAFTVRFSGMYDETPFARRIAAHCALEHIPLSVKMDMLVSEIETIILQYGEPFADSSAIPSYYLSRAAKKHFTVALCGDGGDELFAGYRRYVPYRYNLFFKYAKSLVFLTKLLPFPRNKMTRYSYFFRLLQSARQTGLLRYLSSTTDIFENFQSMIEDESQYLQTLQADFEYIFDDTSLTSLQKIMNMDFNTIFSGDLMVKMDIASMAHSLEVRSPFLARELLEYVPGMSDTYKIKGLKTKYLLRQLVKKYLPSWISSLPKRGFEVPLVQWVNRDLKDMIFDNLLHSRGARQFVKLSFIRQLLAGNVPLTEQKRTKMIWMLFVLEVWFRRRWSN